jgi:hypothetical protein
MGQRKGANGSGKAFYVLRRGAAASPNDGSPSCDQMSASARKSLRIPILLRSRKSGVRIGKYRNTSVMSQAIYDSYVFLWTAPTVYADR